MVAEIGFDKRRSDLSRFQSESSFLERLDHLAFRDVFVQSALRLILPALVARVFRKLIRQLRKVLARFSAVQDLFSFKAFFLAAKFRMLGNVLRDLFIGYLYFVSEFFRIKPSKELGLLQLDL